MQIKMLASRFAAGGVLSYVAGSTYEVANDLALQFIGDNAAVEVNASRTAATGTQRDEFNRGAEGQAGVSLVSEDRITTWSNRAALVTAGLTTAFFTDVGVGGSHWDYVGGRWRPSARRVMLANLTAEQTTNGTSLAVMYSVALLAGLWQDGDILEWRTSHTKSGGTAETATTDWRIGAAAATVGLALGLSSASLATTQTQQHAYHRVRRLTATTARNLSVLGGVGQGVTSAALTTRTIPDADAAASYWQCLGNVSVGAETLTLTGAALYLESGA